MSGGEEGRAVYTRLQNRRMADAYDVENLTQEETRRRLRGIRAARANAALWERNKKVAEDLEKRLEKHLEQEEPYPPRHPDWK